jgi:hypothetical protein
MVCAAVVGIIDVMTVTDAAPSAPGAAQDTPGPESIVVSGTSPLADGFRRFHARAAGCDAENDFFAEDFAELVEVGNRNTDAVLEAIGAVALGAA